MCLCQVSWAQSLIYFHKWAVWKATLLSVATLAVFGGVEAALILTITVSCASAMHITWDKRVSSHRFQSENMRMLIC